MAYETPILDTTLLAAADLSSSQFCFVVVDTNGKAALPSAGANAIGVIQNKPTSGNAVTIRVEGISKALAGSGGVTAGDQLKVANTGAVVTTAATTDKLVGIALQTAASGAYTTVLLKSGTST